jgi:hypothetical protein
MRDARWREPPQGGIASRGTERMAGVAATSRLPGRRLRVVAPAAPSGALVLGADYRALGAVRSLGRRGVPVRVVREPGEPLASM